MRRPLSLIGWAAIVGLAAGVLLDVATFLVARYCPQADSWSFRGNGALAVPFGLGPAILAGAWVALVLRFRGFARWRELGLGAALIGFVFLLVSVLLLALFNSAAIGVSSAMTFVILGWVVVAPMIAALIPASTPRPQPSELSSHLGAAAILTVVLVFAFYIAGL